MRLLLGAGIADCLGREAIFCVHISIRYVDVKNGLIAVVQEKTLEIEVTLNCWINIFTMPRDRFYRAANVMGASATMRSAAARERSLIELLLMGICHIADNG